MYPQGQYGGVEVGQGAGWLSAAMGTANVIAEFDLDGRIICANDKFLQLFGYTADEIAGVHHSRFVDAAYATSHAYYGFWDRLRRGEAIVDKFLRVTKGGREVWLQASYSPVSSASGCLEKVIKFATDVTEQEFVARDAREQLEAISRSQATIEFDLDGRILAANENFCRMMGYSVSEIVGRPHAMFVDAEQAASEEYSAFWKSLRRGHFQASRFRRLAKGGREVWIEAAYNPILGANGLPRKIVKFATNITQQEMFARDARGQIEAIARTQAVIEFLADGTILSANENFCRMMDYDLDQLRGRRHAIFVKPDDAGSDSYRDFWHALARGEHQAGKFLRLARNGRETWIQGTYTPVLDDLGRVVKVVKYAIDVTEREREAETLRRLNEELGRARRVAEEATQIKSQFLATMSHEIRTPMNGIIGMLQVMLRGDIAGEQRDQLLTARDSATSLLHILNDILDYSKLEAGKLRLEIVPYSPRMIVDEVVSMLDAQVRAKHLSMTVEVGAALPEWVAGDPTRFRQLMHNLAGNAVKFTSRGGVTIRIGHGGSGDQARMRVDVIDTGVGIEPAVQATLFERFSQAEASTTRRFGGTGLGLAICRELATAMNGSIGVESSIGQGSRFWLDLPAPAVAGPQLSEHGVSDSAADIEPANILVAEDNLVNQKVLKLLLAPYPHKLTFVVNGAEAVAAVGSGTFDMVFMDVSMPVMDGPAAARAIRALEGPVSRIPILALTANAMVGDREIYLSAGMTDYLTKPIELSLMLDAIARHRAAGRALALEAAAHLRANGDSFVGPAGDERAA